jgi:predicted transcriptional regulator
MTMCPGDEQSFDWDALVSRIIHQTKVVVIEALWRMGRELSANEITEMLDSPEYSLGNISYHLRTLAAKGVLVAKRQRQVRGAIEKFYYFPEAEDES